MGKQKKKAVMKGIVDRMYARICKKYGVNPDQPLSDFKAVTYKPYTIKSKIKWAHP